MTNYDCLSITYCALLYVNSLRNAILFTVNAAKYKLYNIIAEVKIGRRSKTRGKKEVKERDVRDRGEGY
jgi:hypothetical protein